MKFNKSVGQTGHSLYGGLCSQIELMHADIVNYLDLLNWNDFYDALHCMTIKPCTLSLFYFRELCMNEKMQLNF